MLIVNQPPPTSALLHGLYIISTIFLRNRGCSLFSVLDPLALATRRTHFTVLVVGCVIHALRLWSEVHDGSESKTYVIWHSLCHVQLLAPYSMQTAKYSPCTVFPDGKETPTRWYVAKCRPATKLKWILLFWLAFNLMGEYFVFIFYGPSFFDPRRTIIFSKKTNKFIRSFFRIRASPFK